MLLAVFVLQVALIVRGFIYADIAGEREIPHGFIAGSGFFWREATGFNKNVSKYKITMQCKIYEYINKA